MCFNIQKASVAYVVDNDIDIFFTLKKIGNQLMHGRFPWRGGREKDLLSMQIYVEALTMHVHPQVI